MAQSLSTLSNKELIELSGYSVERLALRFAGMSHNDALEFRRQIQIGMARYRESRGYSVEVLNNLLGITAKIEKWCRQAFMRKHNAKGLILNPKEKAKLLSKWETILKAHSY